MVQGGGPQERDIGVDRMAGLVHHVHHLEAVLEGTGGLGVQFAEELAVRVGEFLEPGGGHQVEDPLEDVDERIEGDGEHGAAKQLQDVDPHQAAARIDQAEAREHDHFHPENDQRVQELLPAAVELLEGVHRHDAGAQEHEEEFHAVAGEDQQREQGDQVHGQDHPLGEEGLQVQDGDGERNDVHDRRGDPFHEEGDHRGEGEDGQQVVIALGLREDLPMGEIDAEVQDDHEGQGEEDVPQPEQDAGALIAVHLVVLGLVGIQDLGDFRGDDIALGDDLLLGAPVAGSRRHIGGGFRVAELGHRPVEDEVRDDEVVHARALEQGIEVHVRVGAGDIGQELVLGVGDLVHLGPGILGRPLVPLDVDDFAGQDAVAAVQLLLRVGDHALGVDVGHAGGDGGTQAGVFPEVEALDGLHGVVDDLVRVAVVRDRSPIHLVDLREELFLGLEDREVELGDERLVRPGGSFPVVVIELRSPRHEQHEDCEDNGQRKEPPGYLRRRYLHSGRSLR